jgi:hypothetical protein
MCCKCGWCYPVSERRVDELSCFRSYIVGVNGFYVTLTMLPLVGYKLWFKFKHPVSDDLTGW